MSESWWVIVVVAVVTFAIRMAGVYLGQLLPNEGPWARGLAALPGCLIVGLVAILVLNGGPEEWLAAAVATGTAIATKNLPITMFAGIAATAVLRTL